MILAPKTVYTRGNDTKKDTGSQATERTSLLANETATPKIAYGEIVDEGRAMEDIVVSGDPLTGKLFGKSASQQISSSWFW